MSGDTALGWLRHPAPSDRHRWVVERPIAHRGLFDPGAGIPENSMAAFQRAVDCGFAMELDVRLLADGQLAVFHDPTLKRMTGEEGSIASLSTGNYRRLRLSMNNEPPPLLAEVLELVHDKVGVLIEIKDASFEAAEAVLNVARRHPGPWAALSFHAGVIAWFARYHPHVTRGLNGGVFEWDAGLWASVGMRTFWHAPGARPHFIGCFIQRLGGLAPRWLRSRGLPVVAWTARSLEGYHAAQELSDAVIFEGFLPSDKALSA